MRRDQQAWPKGIWSFLKKISYLQTFNEVNRRVCGSNSEGLQVGKRSKVGKETKMGNRVQDGNVSEDYILNEVNNGSEDVNKSEYSNGSEVV